MVWPRSLPKSSNHWLASPHITSPVPRTLLNKPGRLNLNLENVSVLWCICLVHLSPHRSCPQHHQGSIGQGHHPQGNNCHGSWVTLSSYWNFVSRTPTFLSKASSMNRWGAAMGSPVSPIVANLYMEYLEQKALSTAPHPQVLAQVCGWHLCHPQGNQ